MHKHIDVFISHSGLEKEIANELCNYLESNRISCWIMPRDVCSATRWKRTPFCRSININLLRLAEMFHVFCATITILIFL